MRETVAITVDDAAARRAVARALATWGAAVRVDGEAVVFEGALTGRATIAGGAARFEIATGWRELARVAQAVVGGAAASVAVAIWCGWMFHRALPVGGAVALAWGALAIVLDRRRLRRRLRALAASLPVLTD